ncbi:small nuclear RNA activating complex, subunit SNAP43-domain-containing protein [Kickxella alabastrina]|uniref:small nuclear RNA activating complex, subunit SNAP43-domain-containing protein n=1 Tax=Kickxella alabastrina TaxID=61397 RepID=UPI0022211372|nr:small nuclear RNA activating complex, subunit SNAP43-domain-containing protein [Kickxella alabastrina]KAI7826329.1 small nuclear RNA activating complex, subunit SNAP43-domain-containing protein [Kickxella alabastrina]
MASIAEEIVENDDTKSVVNLGRTGVYLSAIEGDVRTLMRTFQRLQAYDIVSFCEVWKALNFSLIHFVATEKNSRQNFMRTAYRLILGHFQADAILEIRIGVIYALYLMYFTQPVNFPNIGIRVPMDIWIQLTKLYQYCNEAEIRDVVYVFDRLMGDGAFELVAWLDENEGVLRLDGDEDGVSAKVASRLAQVEHEVMGSAQGNLGDLAGSKRQIELAETVWHEFNPDDDLPGAVPLDISDQDTAWAAAIFERAREYQRQRAERVGAVAEDDGSLRLMADYSESRNLGNVSSLAAGQHRRIDLGGIDYGNRNNEVVSTPIRAIYRADQMHKMRSQRPELWP